MSNSKKKKAVIIAKEKTHFLLFLYPLLFLLMLVFYMSLKEKSTIIMIFATLIFLSLQYYMMFYGKKIIVSEKKIYIYVKNKQVVSWDLVQDFAHINIHQTRFSKLFGYGTLIIVNQNRQIFTYHYLTNVVRIYDIIIKQHENNVKAIDPDYEMKYKINESNLDTIDELKETI